MITINARPTIDYQHISNAINFYKALGYQYIEVPWWTNRDITNITVQNVEPFTVGTKELQYDFIGSAEQGFITLCKAGKLKANTFYVACSPCVRNEIEDSLHQQSFMKVELFAYIHDDHDVASIEQAQSYVALMKNNAKELFEKDATVTQYQYSESAVDLLINEVEVGSYGYRRDSDYDRIYIYGTGLAEPRFNVAMTYKRTLEDVIRAVKQNPKTFNLLQTHIEDATSTAIYSADFGIGELGVISNHSGAMRVELTFKTSETATYKSGTSIEDLIWNNLTNCEIYTDQNKLLFSQGDIHATIR